MNLFRKLIVLGICLIGCFSVRNSWALDMVFGANSYSVNVQSFKERRFLNIIKQERDYSCGSAALATLLKYSYGQKNITESAVLNAMLKDGDKEKIKHEGFSMLDIKNYLTKVGLQSGGFRTSLDKLKAVGIPALALINNNGYMHFVVISGLVDNVVIIRDPAFGNRTMNRKEFEKTWNGILFVIVDNKQEARKNFQYKYAWGERKNDLGYEMLNTNYLTDSALQSVYTSNYFNF